jgi:hypothetical protein
MSLDLFGQIEASKDWPISIQREFDLIKEQKIDTVLVYYEYLGPWTSLPDSCNGIPSISILWVSNGKYFARQLRWDSTYLKNSVSISSTPIKFFLNHIKDFKLKDKYYKENTKLLLPPTDASVEHLILMTSKNNIFLILSSDQRTDDRWKQFAWIKSTIAAIDTTKYELKKNKLTH